MSRLSDFLPSREAQLVTWSNNFSALISDTPTAFGLSVPQASAFAVLNSAWIDAFNLAAADATNSRSARLAKNAAKSAMISNARMLAKVVRGFPSITDSQLSDLGLTVPKPGPSPRPAPDVEPVVVVRGCTNRVCSLRLTNADSQRRGKPADASIAYIYSFIGTAPPTDITQWTFQGSTSKADLKVAFSPTTPANAQVWFVACWLNARQQPGPLGPVTTTNISGGVSAEQTMRISEAA